MQEKKDANLNGIDQLISNQIQESVERTDVDDIEIDEGLSHENLIR